jgi:ribosome-binding protein aMBF1 (putative translation factor)
MGHLEPQPQGGALYRPDKGETRNPNGKPKGVPHSKTRLKRLMELTENLTNPITKEIEGFTVAEQLDLAQIIKARKGDTRAYEAILDRLEGKPKQDVNMNMEGGLNIALVEFVGDDGSDNDQNEG